MKRLTVANLLSVFVLAGASAQKLPNVQTASVHAPSIIKIDGKATEWNGQFQAYNHATEIYYTLSNDEQYLYLSVQATIPDIISKIIAGGLTLNIQKSGKKDDKGSMSITFPVFEKNNKPALGVSMDITAIRNGVAIVETSSPKMTDSVIAVRNEQLSTKSKYIMTAGIPSIDSVISLYNDNGIKAAQLIDSKGAYTYELAVDFKLLGLTQGDESKFAYHLILNGMEGPTVNLQAQDGTASLSSGAGFKVNGYSGGITSPTDFWGAYTLAVR